jgi:hypothetical protein
MGLLEDPAVEPWHSRLRKIIVAGTGSNKYFLSIKLF